MLSSFNKRFQQNRRFRTLAFVLALSLLVLSCQQETEPPLELTPWYGKKTMVEQFKWFSKASNYFDSNYTERFYPMYRKFLANNQTDSALYYLLVFSEMIDQNYIFDTVYLNTTKQHLAKYESENTHNNEILKLYYYIASTYFTATMTDSCEKWALAGLSKKNMPKRFQAKCHRTLSEMYHDYSKLDQALPHTLAFLSYFEERKDTLNIGVAYSNMATIYKDMYAYETAEKYYKKALEYSILKKDTLTIASYYQLLCNLYSEWGSDSSKFVFYSNKLDDILRKKSYPEVYLLAVNEDLKIVKFLMLNQLDSIPKHLVKFEAYSREIGDSTYLKNLVMHTARYELRKNNSLPNAAKLEQFAQEAFQRQEFSVGIYLYSILMQDAIRKGNYQKALDFQSNIRKLETRLFELNSKGQLYDKEMQYQTKLKDQQLEIQKENLEVKERNIGLLLALLVIILLSVAIYIFYQKQKELKQKQHYESMFTQQLLDSTEEERMRIARDLHDSVGHELLTVKNSLQNKLQGTEEKIDNILAELREISRNLFPVMFQEIGLKICVEQLATSIHQTDQFYVGTEITYIQGTLNPKDELNLYRIIQEALSNIRKYANAQSAKILLLQNEHSVELSILDNGQGFNVDEALKSGKAFGLISMIQRGKFLNAQVTISSNENGTKVNLVIPLA